MKNIYCLIGNIGVGKTTLVKALEEKKYICRYEHLSNVIFLNEYWKTQKYAFHTQIGFYTMWMKAIFEDFSYSDNVFIDCSLHEYHYVFTKYMYDNKLLTEEEWEQCCLLFNGIINLIKKGFTINHIFIDCPLELNLERIKIRDRTNEINNIDFIVSLNEYLKETLEYLDNTIVVDGLLDTVLQVEEIINKVVKEEL